MYTFISILFFSIGCLPLLIYITSVRKNNDSDSEYVKQIKLFTQKSNLIMAIILFASAAILSVIGVFFPNVGNYKSITMAIVMISFMLLTAISTIRYMRLRKIISKQKE